MLSTLSADAPTGSYAAEMAQFGRFQGSWDLLVTWYREDGSIDRQSDGELEFGYALEGRAVIDVWQVPSAATRACGAAEPPGECGMSVRFYDPRIAAWRSTWHGPVAGVVMSFIARHVGEDMVLERDEDGVRTRWSFTKITEDSFHWLNEVSRSGGPWMLVQDFRARRR